jgi:hypothetical protein
VECDDSGVVSEEVQQKLELECGDIAVASMLNKEGDKLI